MALTESQVASLTALLDEVRALIVRCKDRLLHLDEAKGKLDDLWERSRTIVQLDSDEWRLLDRARKEAPGWWRVESSGYVAARDASHFVHLGDALEQILDRSGPSSLRERGRAGYPKTTLRNNKMGAKAGPHRQRIGKIVGVIVTAFPWLYKAVDAWSNVEFVWMKRSGIVTFLLSDLGLLIVTIAGLFLIWFSFRPRNRTE